MEPIVTMKTEEEATKTEEFNVLPMTGQTVVVTGGAGFIGSHLVKELLDQGAKVRVIDNLVRGKKENVDYRATLYPVSVLDRHALEIAFHNVDYVFHLAALPSVPESITEPQKTFETNVIGTQNVLDVAREKGVFKVILSSSCAVYGDPINFPTSEDSKTDPKSPYALHKLMGEQMLKVYSEVYTMETCSLRYFNVYGPNQNDSGAYAPAIAIFLKQKREGQPLGIVGSGEQTRDFVHVRDVVKANIAAALTREFTGGDVVNIGSGKEISINDLAKMIGGETAKLPKRLEIERSLADISKAERVLGWKPTVTLEDGIAELM